MKFVRVAAPLLAVGFAFYRWVIPAMLMLAVGLVTSLVEDYEYEEAPKRMPMTPNRDALLLSALTASTRAVLLQALQRTVFHSDADKDRACALARILSEPLRTATEA